MRTQLTALAAPMLDGDRRRGLAAEVMARADLIDDTRAIAHAPRVWLGVGAVAIAAAAMLAVFVRDDRALSRSLAVRAFPVETLRHEPPVTPEPPPSATAVVGAHIEPPVEPRIEPMVVVPPTTKPARTSRQVFGGTADRRDGTIERDTLVERAPIAEFRIGWEALHDKRYADAIAAFDRATDPAVAEDAAFWAAIAAQRAGQIDDARKRLDGFLQLFPQSPRTESARRALESLY